MEFTKNQFNQMDFVALSVFVSEKVGIHVELKAKYIIERRFSNIEISAENLAEQSGIFKSVFEKVEIRGFGGDILEKEYWLPIHISWAQKSGGCNGVKLLDAYWNFESKSWRVRK